MSISWKEQFLFGIDLFLFHDIKIIGCPIISALDIKKARKIKNRDQSEYLQSFIRPKKHGGTYKNRGLRIMVKQKGEWKIRTFINQRVVDSTVTPDKVKNASKNR